MAPHRTADEAATETTPLLAASSEGPTLQSNAETIDINKDTPVTTQETNDAVEEDDKPLPKAQIFYLCYARLVEPIAFFSIFPFINKMIEETGDIAETDVGFHSGLIESLFSCTQMLLMISWGRAADRFGRKPVLVFSLAGVSLATCLFGFSKTIWQMVVFRCLAGVFAGTIVTVRVMLSENSTPKTQARAFSLFAFAGNLGIFLGPVIGGALSNPAEQYPGAFKHIQLFRDYPYALPSIVAGATGGSAAIINGLFLKETLKTKGDHEHGAEPPLSTWEVLESPGVPMVLYLYLHSIFIGLAWTAVAPVFWFTSVKLGGYGLPPIHISLLLGCAGLAQAFWLLFVFPPVQHRFGTGGVLRYCSMASPIGFIVSPLCNVILKRGLTAPFWTLAIFNTILGSAGSMTFTGVQLALNDISPSPSVLGTLNALALAASSGIRAFVPALFASLYATGVRNQILDGYLAFVVLFVVAITFTVATWWLPEKAEGKIKRTPEGEA